MERNQGYFDFEEKTELEEDLDFSKLVDCPYCKKPIPHNALLCLYCGESIHTAKKSRWFVWLVIILIILFVLWVL
jgi:predicted nucleic acid-binding Zn ribbon protein